MLEFADKHSESFDIVKFSDRSDARKEIVFGDNGEILGHKPRKIRSKRNTINPTIVQDAIDKGLVKIFQDQKMLQQIGGSGGKGIQISVQVGIVGDSAIEKACDPNLSAELALLRIIEALPEPRLEWFKILVTTVVYQKAQSAKLTAEILGVSPRFVFRCIQKIKTMMNQEVILPNLVLVEK